MLRVTISDTVIETKSGTAKRTGNPYSIREQPAVIDLPNGERRRYRIGLEGDEHALPVGQYEPKKSAFFMGDFDSLQVSNKAKHWELVKTPGKAA